MHKKIHHNLVVYLVGMATKQTISRVLSRMIIYLGC